MLVKTPVSDSRAPGPQGPSPPRITPRIFGKAKRSNIAFGDGDDDLGPKFGTDLQLAIYIYTYTYKYIYIQVYMYI